METRKVLTSFLNWLSTTEMFNRPSKSLPGKWQLFEYYIELDDELLHFKENQVSENKRTLNIEFHDEVYLKESNLGIDFIDNMDNGHWSVSKNFLTFIHPKDFRKNIEFQFAFEKGTLKLLRKDAFGKIQFFGFFRNVTK
jgi:hypothetical protein